MTALEAQGAIVVGKANADEFAWGVCGQNTFYGDTVNPTAPDRVAGGSSSGNAAALAAGMVPLALGTDTGGSVRIPAAACGVVAAQAAGHAVGHRRVDGVAVERVLATDAPGELVEVGLAHDDRALRLERRHGGRAALGYVVANRRAVGPSHARGVDEVLDEHRDAGQRAAHARAGPGERLLLSSVVMTALSSGRAVRAQRHRPPPPRRRVRRRRPAPRSPSPSPVQVGDGLDLQPATGR